MSKAKVLVFDIETAPMLAYVWGRRDQNIAVNQIKKDWYVIAWAAKWLGDPASKVIYRDQRHAKDISNDKAILKDLWKLLDEADIVVTQNGKNFDCKKVNARFIFHGMKPPKPYAQLDTFQIVRSVAQFTSNGLDYLTDKLCTRYKKLKNSGMSLWDGCLAGKLASWKEMQKYNIHDVLSTEELYMKVRAWAPTSAPYIYSVHARKCGVCGENKIESNGIRTTKKARYYRLRCSGCGSHSIGAKVK